MGSEVFIFWLCLENLKFSPIWTQWIWNIISWELHYLSDLCQVYSVVYIWDRKDTKEQNYPPETLVFHQTLNQFQVGKKKNVLELLKDDPTSFSIKDNDISFIGWKNLDA